MVRLTLSYEDDLHTLVIHDPSGASLHTEAPIDSGGKGSTFSPTDLLAASLASCIATMIGAYAKRKGWDVRGMRLQIEKEMSNDAPRRIVRLATEVWIPLDLSESERRAIEKIAESCPVKHSLADAIESPTLFHFGSR